ncbi:P-type ATPase [Trinorchestia longiramus]|nr:P-type ATPase [Trinorchestia longiramus]
MVTAIDVPAKCLSCSKSDLAERKSRFGENILASAPPPSFLRLVWIAAHDTTLIILIVAAVVSLGFSFYHSPEHDSEEERTSGWIEGVAILASVVVVLIVTAFNDWSKERQFRSLSETVSSTREVLVTRDGKDEHIPASELLVGDLCKIQYGDQLTADGVLIRSTDVKMDESSLTGEAELVTKSVHEDPLLFSSTNVMEGRGVMLVTAVGSRSMVGNLMALLNSSGAGEDGSHSKSVLQKKLSKLAVQIGYAGSAIAALTVVVLCLRFSISRYGVEGQAFSVKDLFYFLKFIIVGVTVLVVAVPEGLPLAVTISLAFSVRRMLKDRNLVRHLDACETMGNATTICSDKTGTLTTNRMTVVQAYVEDIFFLSPPVPSSITPAVSRLLGEAISINSSYSSSIVPAQYPQELPKQLGNKTECALLGLVQSLGMSYDSIRAQHPEHSFVKVFTFNSARKTMTTIVPLADGVFRVFTKGASEVINYKCTHRISKDGQRVNHEIEDQIMLEADVICKMADVGLRTIGIAYKDIYSQTLLAAELTDLSLEEQTFSRNTRSGSIPCSATSKTSSLSPEVSVKSESNSGISAKRFKLEDSGGLDFDDEDSIVSGLTLLAIVGVEDPVRPEVPSAISQCRSAGVTVRMVTGDNLATARAIAIKCGIVVPGQHGLELDSDQFNCMIRDKTGQVQQELLDEVWPRLRVLARSTPQDKHTLVRGIMNSAAGSEVVAVTGDGTNDGPALKMADVGFAMGVTGTDVAKEACDIVLTDDNFTSIVKAVMWGRNVYDSIAKFLQFQLTVNIVAVFVAFVSVCVISDTPLKAVQMLWVNLIMDTLASLALATEPPTKELLKRMPYGRKKPLLTPILIRNVLGQAFFMITVIFWLFFYGHEVLHIDSGLDNGISSAPSQHFTVVFNAFVMMTLFNEINARKVHGELNVFSGLLRNSFFCCIWAATFLAQVLLVQYGGHAFSTAPLSYDQWLLCLLLGASVLVWQLVLCTVSRIFTSYLCVVRDKVQKESYPFNHNDLVNMKLQAQQNWINTIANLQSQMRVIRVLKSHPSDAEEQFLHEETWASKAVTGRRYGQHIMPSVDGPV